MDFADLGSSEIPLGPRRLIMQIAKTVVPLGASNPSGKASEQQSVASGSTAQPEITPVTGASTTTTDVYDHTLLILILNHQAQLLATSESQVSSGAQGVSGSSVSANVQLSWNDPQIHIVTATGKWNTSYLDICDFVPNNVDEKTVLKIQN